MGTTEKKGLGKGDGEEWLADSITRVAGEGLGEKMWRRKRIKCALSFF